MPDIMLDQAAASAGNHPNVLYGGRFAHLVPLLYFESSGRKRLTQDEETETG